MIGYVLSSFCWRAWSCVAHACASLKMDNADGLDPCQLASEIGSVCRDGFTVPPLSSLDNST